MYSGKIAVPPGGGGIRKKFVLFSEKIKKCKSRQQMFEVFQRFTMNNVNKADGLSHVGMLNF
jgi:hypothetical protein